MDSSSVPTKLTRQELYEIILSVLSSRCSIIQSKENKSYSTSLPGSETVSNLIKMTQEIFQNETSLLHLNFDQPGGSPQENPDHFIIVGDLHGNIDDLLRIFEENSYPPDSKYIFTGDYIDRGSYSVEIMLLLFSLKNLYPNHIFLLRGNHESQDICSGYGFKNECETKYPNSKFKEKNKTNSSNQKLIEEEIQTINLIDDDKINIKNNTNENGFKNPSFLDLEINLNSMNLPGIFNHSAENSDLLKSDIGENEYFNMEGFHYFSEDPEMIVDQIITQFSEDHRNTIFDLFTESFTYMPLAAVVSDQILCVHGGISPDVSTLDQIMQIHRPCQPSDSLVSNGILWSDPRANLSDGFEPSDRGTGYLFSCASLNDFLRRNGLTYLIRSHEPCDEGFFKPFGPNGRCITVFSNSDYCGINNTAAVAVLEPIQNSELSISPPASRTSSFALDNTKGENDGSEDNMSIIIENLKENLPQQNEGFVNETVSISFKFFRPMNKFELSLRRVIFPRWILADEEIMHKKVFVNDNENDNDNVNMDLLNNIMEQPIGVDCS